MKVEPETALKTGRAVLIADHVRQNNLAYLVGMLLAHQMGFLDKVLTYGTGICS
jgi:hypothetical protein